MRSRPDFAWPWCLCVAMVAGGHAASNMTVEKKEGFQTSVPAALLLDAESDSVLYEKNGDQLVAPASLAKLMTLEYVFNEIKQGRAKLTTSSSSARMPGARAGRLRTARPCSPRSTAASSSTI